MRNSLLIPNRYKVYGWVIFLVAVCLHIANIFQLLPEIHFQLVKQHEWSDDNMLDEIIFSLVLIGLLLISFSREKKEDEYISFLRLRSWQWAVLISYGILFFANWLIYGGAYLSFMIYNMFTVLIVFIIKFNYNLYKLRKGGSHEN